MTLPCCCKACFGVSQAVCVLQGKLPPDYKTAMCDSASSNSPCPYGTHCSHAHSPQELRVDAAIALGQLPEDFRSYLCDSLYEGRTLPLQHAYKVSSAFCHAHSLSSELLLHWGA